MKLYLRASPKREFKDSSPEHRFGFHRETAPGSSGVVSLERGQKAAGSAGSGLVKVLHFVTLIDTQELNPTGTNCSSSPVNG
jgi:hypothetical protein